MPVNFVCDKCGQQSEQSVTLIGSKQIKVLCQSCWRQIENEIMREKETVNINQR